MSAEENAGRWRCELTERTVNGTHEKGAYNVCTTEFDTGNCVRIVDRVGLADAGSTAGIVGIPLQSIIAFL